VQLSKNLSLREATKSVTALRLGVDNTPEEYEIKNLERIAHAIFQPLRDHFDTPIAVTSGFRSKALNEAVGGSKYSQHITGEALDLDAHVYGGVSNAELFDFIATRLEFDQLIWEFGDDEEPAWVHVSLKREGNRGRKLKAVRENGRVTYIVL
jgi:zinc D-Ala-D-Ala carboxypeptidase